MHAPTLHSTYENSTPHRFSASEFLTAHPVLPILRGLFLYSLLWIGLAFVLYGVYTLIVSAN